MSEDKRTGKNGGRVVLIGLALAALAIGYCTFSSNRDRETMEAFIGHLEAGDVDAASALWSTRWADAFRAAATPPTMADVASHAPYDIGWTESGVSGATSYSTFTATGTTSDAAGCVLEVTITFENGGIVASQTDDICPE